MAVDGVGGGVVGSMEAEVRSSAPSVAVNEVGHGVSSEGECPSQ